MKTITNNIEQEIIINKSRFITNLIKINSIQDVELYLNRIKDKYKDATHHCYAYIINNQKKANDDKEPSNTAGIPILNVLEKNNLTNVLCVTTRYFGGIKLGAGGLVRAYTKSVTNCLDKVEIKTLEEFIQFSIIFNYENTKYINNITKDYEIVYKDFTNDIIYYLLIPISHKDIFTKKIKNYVIKIKEIKTILK